MPTKGTSLYKEVSGPYEPGAAVHVAASLGLDEVLYLAVAPTAKERQDDGSNLDATNETRGSSLVIARC